jgi:hypothetical protein
MRINLRTSRLTAGLFHALPGLMRERLGFLPSFNDVFEHAVYTLDGMYRGVSLGAGERMCEPGDMELPPGPSTVRLCEHGRKLLRRVQAELILRQGCYVCDTQIMEAALLTYADRLGPWVRWALPLPTVQTDSVPVCLGRKGDGERLVWVKAPHGAQRGQVVPEEAIESADGEADAPGCERYGGG